MAKEQPDVRSHLLKIITFLEAYAELVYYFGISSWLSAHLGMGREQFGQSSSKFEWKITKASLAVVTFEL